MLQHAQGHDGNAAHSVLRTPGSPNSPMQRGMYPSGIPPQVCVCAPVCVSLSLSVSYVSKV